MLRDQTARALGAQRGEDNRPAAERRLRGLRARDVLPRQTGRLRVPRDLQDPHPRVSGDGQLDDPGALHCHGDKVCFIFFNFHRYIILNYFLLGRRMR